MRKLDGKGVTDIETGLCMQEVLTSQVEDTLHHSTGKPVKHVSALQGEGGRILFNDTMVSITDIQCHEGHHISDHLTITRSGKAQTIET